MSVGALVRNYRMRIETEDPLYYGCKKLKVRGKELANISEAVFHLLELEVLDLSPERQACLDYKLPACPPTIGKLVNLKVLMLDTNELKELPPEIALLQQLERIALSNNQLSSLPPGFKNLKNLQSVHMANNDFHDFPLELCKLEKLEFLDLSDNHLKVLPEQIGEMKALETLLLFINELTKLPDVICTMTGLRCLWIGNNRIRQLPRHFGDLTKLDWGLRYTSSALDGNLLIHPPIEICRMGPDAIERYMSSIYDGKSRSNDSPRKNEDRKKGY